MKKLEVKKRNILLVYTGVTSTTPIISSALAKVADRCDSYVIEKDSCMVTREDIAKSDVVVFSRGADPYMASIAKAAKQAERFCVLYLDDDLYAYNKGNDYGKALIDCLANCDVLWVSNPLLCERYKEYNNEIRCVVSKLYEEIKEVYSPSDYTDEVTILYAGSPAHRDVLQELIVPALNKIYEKDQQFKVVFAGLDSDSLKDCKFSTEYIPWTNDGGKYRQRVAEINANIGLGVILDTEFGNCKFYNKWLEYTKLGVSGIYSDVTPYRLIVNDGFNGLLTKNSSVEWADTIDKLIQNRKLRASIIENAQKQLKEDFIDNDIAKEITEIIPEFESYFAPKRRIRYKDNVLLGIAKTIWRRLRGYRL